MKIHKEGHTILKNQIFLFLLINGLISYYFLSYAYLSLTITLIIFIFSVYFFRIPKRKYIVKENTIYAPADGKIVNITRIKEKEYYKEERILISIFMSPLNVHVNRYPISGRIEYTKYHPGKYLIAWHPKASTKNERNTIVVENKNISILFRQIAGLIARRIVCYASKETNINATNECGFIKFGSRVDIFIPLDSKLNIEINDQVIGGITELANY